jgi:hypothetical protein
MEAEPLYAFLVGGGSAAKTIDIRSLAMFLKAAGIGGSILALIALVIVLIKSLIAFVGFITLAVKVLIVIAFVAVIAAVGFMIFKSWQSRRTAD